MINISAKSMHACDLVNYDIILKMGFRKIEFS